MKGIRFYEEYDSPRDKRYRQGDGNVFALSTDTPAFLGGQGEWCTEGLGALFHEPNSVVCSFVYAVERLRTHCRHISEQRAREIHPALFERLDTED
ncbi:hypothetical protein LCGC14_0532300 [marine sediment metagenome]|uniref:Uncharacterized protein n=1 Tax=marine sediment metagenome TaxID=412755 RepID=A0A0F9UGN2_9ZZZZ